MKTDNKIKHIVSTNNKEVKNEQKSIRSNPAYGME